MSALDQQAITEADFATEARRAQRLLADYPVRAARASALAARMEDPGQAITDAAATTTPAR